MPELPEVETMRRGIAAVVGCQVDAVERPRCRLKPIAITPPVERCAAAWSAARSSGWGGLANE